MSYDDRDLISKGLAANLEKKCNSHHTLMRLFRRFYDNQKYCKEGITDLVESKSKKGASIIHDMYHGPSNKGSSEDDLIKDDPFETVNWRVEEVDMANQLTSVYEYMIHITQTMFACGILYGSAKYESNLFDALESIDFDESSNELTDEEIAQFISQFSKLAPPGYKIDLKKSDDNEEKDN